MKTTKSNNKIAAIILAAGKGTRMKSALPKVMHKVAGRSMIGHALENIRPLFPEKIVAVIGRDMEVVSTAVEKSFPDASCVIQEPQLGTGHAVKQAESALKGFKGTILILYGDHPFIKTATLSNMVETLDSDKNNAVVVLGFTPADPAAYGRIMLGKDGSLDRIVEFKDASEEQRKIRLCNSGVMAVRGELLFEFVNQINNENAKKEYYLTDIISIARSKGYKCAAVESQEQEVMGINSQAERANAEKVIQQELRQKALDNGVVMIAPETVFLHSDTVIASEVTIHPYVVFGPCVKIEKGAEIKSFSHIEGAKIGVDAVVGPFARIRPGTEVRKGARIGNFVEIKNSVLDEGAKANHLSYIGDALVGRESNIGAGVITCNYDGYNKSKTEIGAETFIGSNANLVAPVKIGDGAIIGAGCTIRENVGDDDIAVNDAPQKNLKGKAKSYRKKREQKLAV